MDAFDIIDRFMQECPKDKVKGDESTSQNFASQKNEMVTQKLLDVYNLNNNQDAEPNDYIYSQENMLESKEIQKQIQVPEYFIFQENQAIHINLTKSITLGEGSSQLKQILEEDVESFNQGSFMEAYDEIVKSKSVTLGNTRNNSKKNSNAIKKMGRIIFNNIHCFKGGFEKNEGIEQMNALLNQRAKDKQRPKDLRDGFNTSHLQALFSNCSEAVTSFNLRVAKRLFERKLRSQIFNSVQIKGENKLLYLNTLKCASLRFCNKKLAVRLQISENR